MGVVEVSMEYGGRTLTLQTGKLAKQTDASVLARCGDTMVLVTVVASKDLKEGQDFFPLTVDFQEKYYSAGRVPGGFFKREAKPSEKATLCARLIDRPIRPLFPEDFLSETNVVATVLSIDNVNEPDILASLATSAALHISDIPWNGPIGTCRVGLVDGELVLNPTPEQQSTTTVDLLVSGVRTGVIMVEGLSKEVSEAQMMDAIDFAHEKMQPFLDLVEEFRAKTGNKPKRDYLKPPRDEALKAELKKFVWGSFEKSFAIREKLQRYETLGNLKKEAQAKFAVVDGKEDSAKKKLVANYFEEFKGTYARELTLTSKHRIDGRSYSDIRPITCDVGILPRVHGTGLFTRGETQVLSTVTLGTSEDEQKIDAISGAYQKTFLLHYNFPPFSVGEARPLRPPGRREVGHGFLAERALSFIIPPKEVFPYTLRIVAEVLESNGSSSMATVCSGSLALMDAGVPVPKPVAGVAMGLIKEGERVAVLSDILGDEDHLGDMDFKVCGTAEGITAFQMDLKIGGVSRIIMEQALEQAREGRLHILEKMNACLAQPRASISLFAPRIHTMKVRPEKVREVIGSGGKVIRGIIEETGVKIDIEDDGTIHIASIDEASAQKAIKIIEGIVEEAEPGRIYEGRVSRIAEFGAFVEIIPGTDGLVHISELAHHRVRRVEDVVKEGDVIQVKCLEVDPSGKIRLSLKALLPKNGTGETAPAMTPGPSTTMAPVPSAPLRTGPPVSSRGPGDLEEVHHDEGDNIGNRNPETGGFPRRPEGRGEGRHEGRRDEGPRRFDRGGDRGPREGGHGGGGGRGPRSGGDRSRGGDRPRSGSGGGGHRSAGGPRGGGAGRSGGGDRDRGGMRTGGGGRGERDGGGIGYRDRGGRGDREPGRGPDDREGFGRDRDRPDERSPRMERFEDRTYDERGRFFDQQDVDRGAGVDPRERGGERGAERGVDRGGRGERPERPERPERGGMDRDRMPEDDRFPRFRRRERDDDDVD